MDMEQVTALMKEAGSGFLATTDGERATVRPMGGWAWVDKELWCATGLDSAKVADVQARPQIEYCFMRGDGGHVRIAGTATVSTDAADKQRLLDLVPGLKDYVQGVDNPRYAILRMTVERIRWYTTVDNDYGDVPLP